MLKNVNPGLSRRFQLENAFNFPDFSDEDLVKVAWCCAMSTSITNIVFLAHPCSRFSGVFRCFLLSAIDLSQRSSLVRLAPSSIQVLMMKVKDKDLKISLATAKRAIRKLAKARAKPNFGNAGAVENLISEAVQRKQSRDPASSTLELVDFGITTDGPDDAALDSLFDGLVGLSSIKVQSHTYPSLLSVPSHIHPTFCPVNHANHVSC